MSSDDPPAAPSSGLPALRELPALEGEVRNHWELAASAAQAALSENLVIAFLGSASSGKDAAIRALFGIDFGQVDPIPGSTDRVRVAAMDLAGRVLVVNAPGFGDIRGEVDAEARRVLDRLDLALFLVNADGGASIDERRDLVAIKSLGRPVLVCLNKIDLIRPHQREPFVEATLRQLGVERHEAVITAFDPLPALSPSPIGVNETITWIHDRLKKDGKELLFAKQLRNKAAACEPIIQAAARRSALAGALPVPGADMAAITAVQVKMISDIAAVHGVRMDKDMVLFIIGEALAGTSKGFIRWGIEALKSAGWIPGTQLAQIATSAIGATVAGAACYGVGHAAVAFVQKGLSTGLAGGTSIEPQAVMSGAELRDVFDVEAVRWKERERQDE